MEEGISISEYNTVTDIEKVAQNKDFIILRLAKGMEIDKEFEQRYEELMRINQKKKKGEQPVGIGIYTVPLSFEIIEENPVPLSLENAGKQVELWIGVLNKMDIDTRKHPLFLSTTPGLDAEERVALPLTKEARSEILKAVILKLKELEHEITGIATSAERWDDYYSREYDFAQHELWLFHWTEGKEYYVPKCWADREKTPLIWDYTKKGKVEGIKGEVCLDKGSFREPLHALQAPDIEVQSLSLEQNR